MDVHQLLATGPLLNATDPSKPGELTVADQLLTRYKIRTVRGPLQTNAGDKPLIRINLVPAPKVATPLDILRALKAIGIPESEVYQLNFGLNQSTSEIHSINFKVARQELLDMAVSSKFFIKVKDITLFMQESVTNFDTDTSIFVTNLPNTIYTKANVLAFLNKGLVDIFHQIRNNTTPSDNPAIRKIRTLPTNLVPTRTLLRRSAKNNHYDGEVVFQFDNKATAEWVCTVMNLKWPHYNPRYTCDIRDKKHNKPIADMYKDHWNSKYLRYTLILTPHNNFTHTHTTLLQTEVQGLRALGHPINQENKPQFKVGSPPAYLLTKTKRKKAKQQPPPSHPTNSALPSRQNPEGRKGRVFFKYSH